MMKLMQNNERGVVHGSPDGLRTMVLSGQQRLLGLLIFMLMVVVQPLQAAQGDSEARLHRFFNQLQSMQANFEQTVLDADGQVIQQSRGVFYLSRPDQFRWDYQSPFLQSIVADGEHLIIYDADLEQVTINPLNEMLENSPALFLIRQQPLSESFNIIELGEKEGLDWLRLTPIKVDSPVEYIELALDDHFLHYMELADSLGNTTQLRFEQSQVNHKIKSSIFRFIPPEGVDVIDNINPQRLPHDING